MAIKFFEKPMNAEEFGNLDNFEMFKREAWSKNIYMKIPEVYVQQFDGRVPKNSMLIYGDTSRYIHICDSTSIFPVKSEIQIYE